MNMLSIIFKKDRNKWDKNNGKERIISILAMDNFE